MSINHTGRTYAWQSMASPITLQLPDRSEPIGLAVARAVAKDLEETEQALSRFSSSAELVQLNERLGEWVSVSPRLYCALAASLRAHRMTGGLFDPRVIGALEAIGYLGAARGDHQPLAGPLLERQPRERLVRIAAPLDLGGIGKGLAVRWGAGIVRRMTRNYLLNAGGDLLLDGPGPDGTGWKIGIEDPSDTRNMLAVLELRSRTAVCTSSIGRLHWQHEGQEVHHLIDPATGRPGGQGLRAVTVVGSDPAWAEVHSKTLFLKGAEGIAEAAAAMRVFWVLADGTTGHSLALERDLLWLRDAQSSAN